MTLCSIGIDCVISDIKGQFYKEIIGLEDLKVLRRSPDLLNNVKIGQGQLQLIMEQILFYHICCRHFGQVT